MRIMYCTRVDTGYALSEIFEDLLEKDTGLLTRILEVIRHVASNKGHPQMPYSLYLRGKQDLCEIRTQFCKGELLRIYYFVDKASDTLVLLNALIKPDGRKYSSSYEKNAGKKLKKEIEVSIHHAQQLKDIYPMHTQHYDTLPL